MVVTFPGCAMISYWLPHTPVQIFFHLILDVKKFGIVSFLFEYTNWSLVRLY